jgi:hypothetical protein
VIKALSGHSRHYPVVAHLIARPRVRVLQGHEDGRQPHLDDSMLLIHPRQACQRDGYHFCPWRGPEGWSERETKIRRCPGRQTSSRVRTQQDTTRRNQHVTADWPPSHRRPVHQATKVGRHVAASRARRVVSVQVPPRTHFVASLPHLTYQCSRALQHAKPASFRLSHSVRWWWSL